MKLIVGLGNPGKRYENTRHNVGFLVLDEIQKQISSQFSNNNFESQDKFKSDVLRGKNLILVKPKTFMNDSGSAVFFVSSYYKIPMDKIYIVHDDLDISLGEFKIQKGKGPRDHNGILSVEKALGKKDFWRVRVGVENRKKRNLKIGKWKLNFAKMPGDQYVLNSFTKKERSRVDQQVSKIVAHLIKNELL